MLDILQKYYKLKFTCRQTFSQCSSFEGDPHQPHGNFSRNFFSASPANSIFCHEEILEFDQRLRRYRKRGHRPRYFRRSSLRHTMPARGAVFDWHRVSYIVECFKKEGTSGLRVLNNKSRSPVDFLFHTPTNTAIRIRGSLPF